MRHPHHHPVDPLGAPLGEAVVPFMAGLVFGGALIFCLRHRRLRWTRGLFLVPLAYGSWLVSWRAGLLLAVGNATTIIGGARVHIEAIGRGVEEARAARSAIGPWVVLRSLIAERGIRDRRKKGPRLREDR